MAARLVGVEDMDEVLITAYVKAYRALPRLGDGTTVHAWLYRITYMACLDVLRREWRRTNRRPHRPRREFPTAPASRVSSAHPSMASNRDVLIALDDLPADQRAVLLLVDRHHVPLADVGAMLDVHPRQIAGVLTRARAAFDPGDRQTADAHRTDAGEPISVSPDQSDPPNPTIDQPTGRTNQPNPAIDQNGPTTDRTTDRTDQPDTAIDQPADRTDPADPAPEQNGPATDLTSDPANYRLDVLGVPDLEPEPLDPATYQRELPGLALEPFDPATNRTERLDARTEPPDARGPATGRTGLPHSPGPATHPPDRSNTPGPVTDPPDLPRPPGMAAGRTDLAAHPLDTGTGRSGLLDQSTGHSDDLATLRPDPTTDPTNDLATRGPDPTAVRSDGATGADMDLRDPLADRHEPSPESGGDARHEHDGGATRRLDEITVPGHGRRFWHTLGTKLLAERAAPAMPPPSMRGPALTPKPIATVPADEPPFDLEQLVRRADRRRRRLMVSRRQGLIAVTTVAAVAFGAVALQLGGNAQSPLERQGPIAQEIAAGVSDRLAGLVGFRATIDVTQMTGDGTERSQYETVIAPDGSYLIISADTERSVAYDATSDVRRERAVTDGPAGPLVVAREATGFAGGTPDTAPEDIDLVTADVRAALRAVRGEERRLAESSSVGGRRVWALSAKLPADRPDGADTVRLSVDQDELLPVEVVVSADGEPIRLTNFRDVVPNEEAPREMFTLAFGPDDPLEKIGHGFAPLLLADVAGTVGFEPLQPTYLPAGFTLDTARVRLADKVVSLRYERGFEQVVVSTRPSPVRVGEAWPDPFPRPDGPVRSTPVNLTAGAILGNRADLVAGATGGPQLWGSNGMLAVTVAGDVTTDELTLIGESLR
jgi:RNA polymerase sigma factor (sigma-70 family)